MDNNKVMKALGITILKDLPISREIECIGVINGFYIYPKSYYWVIRGKMPLKYADELYEFRNSMGIRVDGGANDSKPTDWCTSEEFEKYKDEQVELIKLIGLEEFSERVTKKHAEILTNKEVLYVETYHIDELEGLNKVVETIKKYDIKTDW